jgi:hypothetical protein
MKKKPATSFDPEPDERERLESEGCTLVEERVFHAGFK